ncbi:MAG: NADH-quinone oxidoreductase subunit NuoB [Actinomycetota bacterium]|nr:NADH-quinone oxidoreductase subunit NuoB [Actinomycetota bacterium]
MAQPDPDPTAALHLTLTAGRSYRLSVVSFGLACCAVEFVAASMAGLDLVRLGLSPTGGDLPRAEVLVVAGTVTDKIAPFVRRLYESLPDPTFVMSFGACANCGGPYWDSYAVTKGIDQILPVDVYVPGCPPRPEALVQGLVALERSLAPGSAA